MITASCVWSNSSNLQNQDLKISGKDMLLRTPIAGYVQAASVFSKTTINGVPAPNTQMQPTVINKVPFARVRRAAADLER